MLGPYSLSKTRLPLVTQPVQRATASPVASSEQDQRKRRISFDSGTFMGEGAVFIFRMLRLLPCVSTTFRVTLAPPGFAATGAIRALKVLLLSACDGTLVWNLGFEIAEPGPDRALAQVHFRNADG